MARLFRGVCKFKHLRLIDFASAGTAYETLAKIIDGYGIALDRDYSGSASNRLFGLDINTDTGGTDLTGDTFEGAIRGRVVIGTAQSNCSLYGTVGNIDVGTVALIQGNFAGIYGSLDFYGSLTIGTGAACYAAAGIFTVWNEATTTVHAGSVLSGVDIVENGAATVNGKNPAINIRGNWVQALGITGSCVSAKSAGSAASGLQILINVNGSAYALPVCVVGVA